MIQIQINLKKSICVTIQIPDHLIIVSSFLNISFSTPHLKRPVSKSEPKQSLRVRNNIFQILVHNQIHPKRRSEINIPRTIRGSEAMSERSWHGFPSITGVRGAVPRPSQPLTLSTLFA